MKHAGKRFKTLAIALKEIEQFVRNGEHLQTGKTFANFGGMRSREILANWLISVVFNDRVGAERLTFIAIGEEIGGDGVLCDTETNETWPTEHVMVPRQNPEGLDLETRILGAVAAKQTKGDAAYAEGKTLIVFVNAGGEEWLPNRVAKAVTRPIIFGAIWIVGLQTVDDGAYVYNVVELDEAEGVGHVWRVRIASGFDGWTVEQVQ
ncbi:hypothetical protein ABIF65_008832 [Bradyrhizobium japonicum]|uniref:hypothetical protein n=1 Tax=Bradyrhizobium liaoningense TaxID=43992 RepID=UPI001BABE363|nr:hypothetical protein [Bradyrhizobium liaoningense]MBR0880289.1 hypothetical protein [Bradyrhizobium liaoningense]